MTDPWTDWVDANPLRSWRGETATTILKVASALRSSVTSVQYWERGVVTPGYDFMGRIAALLGTDRESLTTEWQDWLEGQPEVVVGR